MGLWGRKERIVNMMMKTFIELIFVGIFWNQVDARPQETKGIVDLEEDADFWYGYWGYGGIPAPSSKKVIVAKVTEDIGSRADKIIKSADAEPEGLMLHYYMEPMDMQDTLIMEDTDLDLDMDI